MANAHDLLMAQRAAMMGGKLPYDAEVEWIGADNSGINSSTQPEHIPFCVDTGVVAGLYHRWEIGVQFIKFGSVAGCYGKAGDRFAFGRGSASWSDWYFGLGSVNTRTGHGTVYDGAYHDFVLDAEKTTWKIDDIDGPLPFGMWSDFGGSLYLFVRHAKDATIDTKQPDSSDSRLYYSRLYENDTLIQDLIPVRFTNENGVTEGAMYNRLGVGGMNPDGTLRDDGIFRNIGTGTFEIGPDKT